MSEPSTNGFTYYSDLDPVKVIIDNKVDVERSFTKAAKRIVELEERLERERKRNDELEAKIAMDTPALPELPLWMLPVSVLQAEKFKIEQALFNRLTWWEKDEFLAERLQLTWDVYNRLKKAVSQNEIPREDVMAALKIAYGILVDHGQLQEQCSECNPI